MLKRAFAPYVSAPPWDTLRKRDGEPSGTRGHRAGFAWLGPDSHMLVPWPMRDDLVLWVIWGSSAVVLCAALGLAYSLM